MILQDIAMQHTPAGGEVRLEVSSSAKEGRMEPRDNGCGIDAVHLDGFPRQGSPDVLPPKHPVLLE